MVPCLVFLSSSVSLSDSESELELSELLSSLSETARFAERIKIYT